MEEAGFAHMVRRLADFYLYFAGINVVLGAIALVMLPAGYTLRPWEPWPHLPLLGWTYTGPSAWTLLVARVGLSLVAWHGLKTRADWGRLGGVAAAIVAVTQFPIGLVLGAYTLVKLVGKRSASLYTALVSGMNRTGHRS